MLKSLITIFQIIALTIGKKKKFFVKKNKTQICYQVYLSLNKILSFFNELSLRK